jgi:hypothetical protein
VRLVAILFDFTFVRSISASAYSAQGGHCYDPASLSVLLVFAFVNGYEYLSYFVADLHDPYRGHQYRVLAGTSTEYLPQEADFTNFIRRCGPLFDLVFHIVVEIVRQSGFISGRALTTDGLLVTTWSRYQGGGKVGRRSIQCRRSQRVGCQPGGIGRSGFGHRVDIGPVVIRDGGQRDGDG